MSNQRWQYKVETVVPALSLSFKPDKIDAEIQDCLTRLGIGGWELVSVVKTDYGNQLYLKRQT